MFMLAPGDCSPSLSVVSKILMVLGSVFFTGAPPVDG
jgi:hypothetical protein